MAEKGNTLSTYWQSVESLHLGNKSSNTEDEIVTWLQCPLDYTLERAYCSEIFGKISSLLGKANLNSDQGVPISMENGGTRGGVSTVTENAKNALALGAGRASGYVVPDGAEAFTKVKTLTPESRCRQANTPPCIGSRDLVPPSPLQMSHEKDDSANSHTSVHSQGFANVTLLSEKYPAYGVMHNFPANKLWASASPVATTQGMESLQLSKVAAAGSTLCQSSSAIISKDPRKGSDAHTQVTHTQGSSYSLITEDHIRDTPFSTVRAGDWGAVCPASYDADTSVRLTSLSLEGQWQETFGNVHAEVPDVVPSCSGGSQTSAELSPKETSSMGKQKLEDYDCQSKNAEVDSADTSQLHRRPSKRSRVAESHNLSEKRRRNRINEKLKTLQELIPNSSKTDKASILDEAIEYLKALQSQLQMMSSRSGMRLSPMVAPAGMQHIQMAQMAPVHPMGLGLPLVPAGMGMGVGMGLMDLTHGMDGRPLPGTTPHFNLAHPALAPLPSQICGRSYANMEVPSSEFWPLQQPSANGYQQVYDELQMVSSVEVHQQGEQLLTPRVSKDK